MCKPKRPEGTPSEADEILVIAAYLGIEELSAEIQAIVGQTGTTISDLPSGRRRKDAEMRGHIDTVTAVIERLRNARSASTGRDERDTAAGEWLRSARIPTSRGIKSPLEILGDTSLAMDALRDLL